MESSCLFSFDDFRCPICRELMTDPVILATGEVLNLLLTWLLLTLNDGSFLWVHKNWKKILICVFCGISVFFPYNGLMAYCHWLHADI